MRGPEVPVPRRRRAPGVRRRPSRDDALPVDGDGAQAQLAALFLGPLLVAGSVLGSLNLLIDGVLRPGPLRLVCALTMVLLLCVGLALVVRQRARSATIATLVVAGDIVHVVVAEATTEPLLYASPLMLLFCCAAAAWFLGPRMLAVHMLLVVGACALALRRSYPDTVSLVVQVAVNAAVLDMVTLGVFVLRRRVERLLTYTVALSSTDPLTGLSNRRFLVEQAPRIWRQARRDGQRVAALVLDVDHFKRLNDAFGHATGDAVLRGVAAALVAVVRPPDVLARTGGEELVVLALVSDPAEARHLAERLRLAVAASGIHPDQRVTVSIGVALARPGQDEDATDALWKLVDRADAAMYEAKQQGRDQVVVAEAGRVAQPRAQSATRRVSSS